MTPVFRTDLGSLRSPRRLDSGRMIVEGVLTRTGVFTYRNDDGTERRELRLDSEVFAPKSMESFQLVPVTDNHPAGMVTAESVSAVAVGTTGEGVRRDETRLVAPLAINDAGAVAKLDAGKTSLSCGYICDLELKPGVTPGGERFDAIQRNIRGNHVALVETGRAGPEARIRMDGAAHQTPHQETSAMEPKLIETLEKLAVQKARADKAEADLTAANTRADRAEAERDAAKEAQAEGDKLHKDAAAKLDATVQSRVNLLAVAAKLASDFECKGKTDREIKVACAKVDCEGKSDDYVQARYDMAIEKLDDADGEQKIYAGMKKSAKVEHVDGEIDSEKSYQAMLERNRNAHKAGE